MLGKQPLYIRRGPRPPRTRRAWSHRLGTVLFVGVLIAVNYVVFHEDEALEPLRTAEPAAASPEAATPEPQGPAGDGVVPPGAPAAPGEGEADDAAESERVVLAGRMEAGDRIIERLVRLGLAVPEARLCVSAMERVFDFRNARVGDAFEVEVNAAGGVERFAFNRSLIEVYEVVREGEAFAARRKEVVTAVERAAFGCVVGRGFVESLRKCTGDAALTDELTRLIAWVVDPATEARENDEVRVVVERVLADGQFLRFGRVLAVEYRGKFQTQQLFHFTNGDGTEGHFTPEGHSLARRFLRSPLTASARPRDDELAVVPQAHVYRRHSGIDYPVRRGTEVVAVDGGTVVFAGPKGNSGTLVTIQHPNNAVSYYAHLSRLARGLRKGAKVSQGDVIALSGNSGKAPEPVLHFALKVDGKFVHPVERRAEPRAQLSADEQARFSEVIADLSAVLAAIDVRVPEPADS